VAAVIGPFAVSTAVTCYQVETHCELYVGELGVVCTPSSSVVFAKCVGAATLWMDASPLTLEIVGTIVLGPLHLL